MASTISYTQCGRQQPGKHLNSHWVGQEAHKLNQGPGSQTQSGSQTSSSVLHRCCRQYYLLNRTTPCASLPLAVRLYGIQREPFKSFAAKWHMHTRWPAGMPCRGGQVPSTVCATLQISASVPSKHRAQLLALVLLRPDRRCLHMLCMHLVPAYMTVPTH